jgi:hypothetical protein
MEAASGFEPLNRGFADLRLNHLATPPHQPQRAAGARCQARMERETGFEPATPTLARLCSTTELFPQTHDHQAAAYRNKRFAQCQLRSPAGGASVWKRVEAESAVGSPGRAGVASPGPWLLRLVAQFAK